MLKLPKLHPGDKIAVVSLLWGGPGTFPHRYEAGKRQLEETFGVQVVEMPHALADPGWIAHNPQAHAADLMAAFADPSIKAIIASIGGEDSIRTLPYTDLAVLRANPKIFMGYSDTTIIHFACFKGGKWLDRTAAHHPDGFWLHRPDVCLAAGRAGRDRP